jgi:hypothetical protein
MEEKNQIPSSPSLKWWHITIISLISVAIYLATKIVIFDYIFAVGLIYSIVLAIKSRKNKKV